MINSAKKRKNFKIEVTGKSNIQLNEKKDLTPQMFESDSWRDLPKSVTPQRYNSSYFKTQLQIDQTTNLNAVLKALDENTM